MVSFLIFTSIDRNYFDIGYPSGNKYHSIAQYLVTKPLPTTDEWKEVYANDKDTNFLIGRLK